MEDDLLSSDQVEEEMESVSPIGPIVVESTSTNISHHQQVILQQCRGNESSRNEAVWELKQSQESHAEEMQSDDANFEGVELLNVSSDPASIVESTVATTKQLHCQRITLEQYRKEGIEYTREAVRELKQSEDYKIHTQKCHSCGASWYCGEWSESCVECDGHAIRRACPICKGLCNQVWKRDVDMSHYNHRGFWDGECGLGEEEKRIHYYRTFVDLSEEGSLCDAIDDISIK